MANEHLERLLETVEAAAEGSPELDREFAEVFSKAPINVSTSIDAIARLIESELSGWWWTCGYCIVSNDASLYVPASRQFPCATAVMGPDFRSGREALRLLEDRRWGKIFDRGFHRDRRGGTVPLAMLAVFLEAKIVLEKFRLNKLGRRGEVARNRFRAAADSPNSLMKKIR
jgi:hypothetical protein